MVTEEVGADAPIFFGFFMKKKQTRKNKLTLKDEYKSIPKLLKEERYEEAEPLFDKFVAEQSAENVGFSNLLNYGRLKVQRKKYSDAEKAACLAISVEDKKVEAPELLLEIYLKQKAYVKALKVADRLLEAIPGSMPYKINRISVLSNLTRSDEMISYWESVCEEHPEIADMPGVQHGLLHALLIDGRVDEASEYFSKFKEGCNGEWSAWLALNEPHILTGLGNFDGAIESLTHSMTMDPENIIWQWNRGLVRLSNGNLEEGWNDYACRWSWPDFPSPEREISLPLWEYQDLSAKSIVISAEQGLGDQVMFSVVIAAIIQMQPARIRVEVQEKAISLFKLWYPECEIFAWANNRDIDVELESTFDYHCPMATAVSYFMNTRSAIDNLPRRHLKLAEHEKNSLLGEKFSKYPIKIGLCWRSAAVDGDRIGGYMSVAFCQKIIEALPEQVGFVIVQYKFVESEREILEKYPNVFFPPEDLFDDILLNAKYCASCDVVVSAPTVVAQLCGVFGVPCITWSTYKSWVTLGFDSPPWFGNLLTIPHKINMAKGVMADKILNILKSSVSKYFREAN